MPKQWIYTLALLFVLFLIYADPAGAGEFAGSFFSMLGRLASGVVTFFQSAADTSGADEIIVPKTTQPPEFGGLNAAEDFGQLSN